jgi:N-formylglutamate deformylase
MKFSNKAAMTQFILHIPHSSLHIPEIGVFSLPVSEIQSEILRLTDWFTDDLFEHTATIVVKADFSRVFCDVERFADDEKEVMAKSGMGVLYTHTDDGKLMRKVEEKDRNEILEKYYYPFHQRLKEVVNEHLLKDGKAIILDCHSFPDVPFKRDFSKMQPRPDFNIGTDEYHTPKAMIEKAVKYFEKLGYSVGIDWPYSGTMVPMEFYKTNPNVHSIMLEVNRKLYLEEVSNRKSENYIFCKKVVHGFMQVILQ